MNKVILIIAFSVSFLQCLPSPHFYRSVISETVDQNESMQGMVLFTGLMLYRQVEVPQSFEVYKVSQLLSIYPDCLFYFLQNIDTELKMKIGNIIIDEEMRKKVALKIFPFETHYACKIPIFDKEADSSLSKGILHPVCREFLNENFSANYYFSSVLKFKVLKSNGVYQVCTDLNIVLYHNSGKKVFSQNYSKTENVINKDQLIDDVTIYSNCFKVMMVEKRLEINRDLSFLLAAAPPKSPTLEDLYQGMMKEKVTLPQ